MCEEYIHSQERTLLWLNVSIDKIKRNIILTKIANTLNNALAMKSGGSLELDLSLCGFN